MGEEILKLKSEGKSYSQIAEVLGCSKGTIAYHCGKGQKEKSLEKQKVRRKSDVFISKMDRFRNRVVSEKARSFQRREGSHLTIKQEVTFTLQDVKNKFGENPICYLSGRKINLFESKSFHFDHIIPATKGGSNMLDNLGMADAVINHMKYDLSVDEFLNTCKEILEYNGYSIVKLVGN